MKTFVLLDRIRSMYNVGSFFRTCDGVGVVKLYLTGYTAYPPRPQISKTALGAEEVVPWEYCEDVMKIIEKLKNEGVIIVSVEKNEKSKDFSTVNFKEDDTVCFIFGNEVEGVSEEIQEISDFIIHLPMRGEKASLNVAVSGGAVLYHDFEKKDNIDNKQFRINNIKKEKR